MKITIYSLYKSVVLIFVGLSLLSFQQDKAKLDFFESIYAHTDRPMYFPGETIWFKAYVVNESKTISPISEMMYVDLISPKGSVVKTMRLGVLNGYSYGNIEIKKDWVGGQYTLKMYTNWMRNFGESHFFTKNLTVQKVVQPNLLMTLKYEKEAYGPGGNVVANFEVKNLKNEPLTNKEVEAILRIQGSTSWHKTLRTNAQGKLKASFMLPKNLQDADVVLNMRIAHKGSTESISRSVPVLLKSLDLQFFPESGNIIAGTSNQVAFKAVNEYGKPADISGKIIDEFGTVITDFESFHDGMGGFTLQPEIEKKYYALLTKPYVAEEPIPLPKVLSSGVCFSLHEKNEKIMLSFFDTEASAKSVKVSNISGLLYHKKIRKGENSIVIDTKKFPIGITKFAILDEAENILAERLAFVNKQQQLQIDLEVDKETYNTREKVVVKIKTASDTGTPISSNLSIAVADNKLLSFADDKQDHILSYLLMSSELKGKIHNPIFYFDDQEEKVGKALDFVMLTHGWRSYITQNEVSFINAVHQPEQIAIQHGAVVDTNGDAIKAHILVFTNDSNKVLSFQTDDQGLFSFKLSGNSRFEVVAYTDDNKKVYIHRKNQESGYASKPARKKGIPNPSTPKGFFGVIKPNAKKTITKEAKAFVSMEEDASALEEVVVTAQGIKREKRALGFAVSHVNSDDIEFNGDVARVLQGKASGVQITSATGVSGSASQVTIRGLSSFSGNNQALIVVDGVPMNSDYKIDVNPEQIESINVLRDLAASTLYGSRGRNGVILVSTKSYRSWSKSRKKLNNNNYRNYASKTFYRNRNYTFDHVAKFYVPVYEGTNLPEERTDFRSTIYWNPVIQTDLNGEACIEFYNSDAVTSFNVAVEGIGYNGLVGRKEKNYSTKKMLNLDFKTPSYITINDIVVLPLTITNDSDRLLFANLHLDLPEHLMLIDTYDNNISIEPNSSMIKNVRVVAKKKGENLKIRASVASNLYGDVMHKEVTVLSPYFPIQSSYSGVDDEKFQFEVNNPRPNSITAEFITYTDIVGTVMNGIEATIRQPYGCFEQVSSATYPNILILKYLKEVGKNKPRIERRAKKFISDGYRRMAAYETKENGFEWYGKTPPHEALSAYGLMQFEEMKSVHEGVDQKMIDRTIKWLLGRRDHKGGFLQNKGKYGFSSAPADVNNAYIVYALTESKVKAGIEKEYRNSYFNALDSLDTYKLSLLALASNNLGKIDDYENLVSYIKLNIRTYGYNELPVKSTITRSYGASKKTETLAFALLALMRSYTTNEAIIHDGIKVLLKHRRYGRFGSTQATAMALKALIKYTRMQKQKNISKNDYVELQLNGHTVRKKLSEAENGKIRINSLEKYLKTGKQMISVAFGNKKNSYPYTMNVNWESELPDTSINCKVKLETEIIAKEYKVGDLVRMNVSVVNPSKNGLPMTTAIIGIPSGAAVQPWQLKKIKEENEVAYYEVFDNYLVLYWREMGPDQTKEIHLDLKAEIAGNYQAPASSVYLYYGDEFKDWIPGNQLTILK